MSRGNGENDDEDGVGKHLATRGDKGTGIKPGQTQASTDMNNRSCSAPCEQDK